jgi:glutamine phosphoribosylpyrophosphate amidotransferase
MPAVTTIPGRSAACLESLATHLCYLDLQKLEHRGEEGAGIVAADAGGKLNI